MEIGINHRYRKEEDVIFQGFKIFHVDPITGDRRFKKAYRIIDFTPIAKKNRAGADIKVYHKNRNDLHSTPIENIVYFYFTSLEISSGIAFDNWNDGKPLKVALNNNSKTEYDIQPEQYKFLEKTGNCQQEPYFQCIAKQLDIIEFKNCSKKCLPYVFSNVTNINFSIPFCQNFQNEHCALKTVKEIVDQKIGVNCKKSCSKLKYLGDTVINVPYSEEDYPEWNTYWLSYTLNNEDFKSKLYEEYLLYDVIDTIGSFGGTLGICNCNVYVYIFNFNTIKFSFYCIRNVYWIFN